MSRFGAPQLVIANAGVSVGTHGDDPRDIAKLRRLLEVNVIGLAATLAAFAPAMRAARNGTLCGIASVAGMRGRVHQYRGIPLIVTYHPAYLLRSLGDKAKAWADLCFAVDTMKDLQTGAPAPTLYENV